jgi:hypothetical protein
MIDIILQTFPILFGVMSLFCDTKTKMVVANFLTAVSWIFAFGIDGAWAGVLVCVISGGSSLYTAIYSRVLQARTVICTICIMLIIILSANIYTDTLNLISFLPLLAFSVYRYGELGMKEYGYRFCGIVGGLLYIAYATITGSWGIVVSEIFFVLSNLFYTFKLVSGKKNDSTLTTLPSKNK